MKLLLPISIYIVVLVSYLFTIKLIDGKSNDFEVLIFDYPRHGIVLFLCFLIANLIILKKNRVSYPFILFWLPFSVFLIISAIVYFHGFVSIGAPFRKNVFINLLLAHSFSFSIIKYVAFEKMSKS